MGAFEMMTGKVLMQHRKESRGIPHGRQTVLVVASSCSDLRQDEYDDDPMAPYRARTGAGSTVRDLNSEEVIAAYARRAPLFCHNRRQRCLLHRSDSTRILHGRCIARADGLAFPRHRDRFRGHATDPL